jgi:hypothetical protein
MLALPAPPAQGTAGTGAPPVGPGSEGLKPRRSPAPLPQAGGAGTTLPGLGGGGGTPAPALSTSSSLPTLQALLQHEVRHAGFFFFAFQKPKTKEILQNKLRCAAPPDPCEVCYSPQTAQKQKNARFEVPYNPNTHDMPS